MGDDMATIEPASAPASTAFSSETDGQISRRRTAARENSSQYEASGEAENAEASQQEVIHQGRNSFASVSKFWQKHVSVTVDHVYCRDHLGA